MKRLGGGKTLHFSSGSVLGKIKQFPERIYACNLEEHKS